VNTLAVVVGVGARTSVGLTAKHTAFLLRAGSAGFHEAPLLDTEDEPVTIGSVPTLDPLLVGADRVTVLAQAALDEALEALGPRVAGLRVRVVLGLDEHLGRKEPGKPSQADLIAGELHARVTKLGPAAVTVEGVARGEASAGLRLQAACEELTGGGVDVVLLGGAHSDYDPEIVQRLSSAGRLFGAGNVNGVIPGESAAFVVLATPSFARQRDLPPRARLHGIGTGFEKARPDNDLPASDAQGLTLAVRGATAAMEAEKLRAGWILTDMTAEVHRVYEWQTVFVRAQRFLCHPQWLEAPAQKLGRLGAAALPVQIAIASTAWRHGFGPHALALSMVGSDSGERVATVWSDPGEGAGVQLPLEAPPPG
jgi:3-oxoacyl-[acyl-carrier-protein] synthase-1